MTAEKTARRAPKESGSRGERSMPSGSERMVQVTGNSANAVRDFTKFTSLDGFQGTLDQARKMPWSPNH